MTLTALREDALRSDGAAFTLRLSLPWIRSLPIASLTAPTIVIDGRPAGPLHIVLGDRAVPVDELSTLPDWWYVQDRVVLRGEMPVGPGAHEVAVSFRLVIPYLPGGPDAPLTLPFQAGRTLVTDAEASAPTVSRDVA